MARSSVTQLYFQCVCVGLAVSMELVPSQRKGFCMFLAVELIILYPHNFLWAHYVSIGYKILFGLTIHSQLPWYFVAIVLMYRASMLIC